MGVGFEVRAVRCGRLARFRRLLLATVASGLMLTGGIYERAARAYDVNITTSTNNGIDLDTFSGSTVQVAAGVTVANTTATIHCSTFPSICATTQAWTLTNNGTISSQEILFTAGGSIINFGSISGNTNSIWIQGGTSASVDNKFGATITGAIVLGENDPVVGTVTNAGTITNDFQAVGLWNGGTVTNLSTGVIQGHGEGNAVAVILGTSRTVNNYGLIQSNDAGYGTGVSLQSGTLNNYLGGRILGAYNAVWTYTAASTITNEGYLEASKAQGGGSAIEVDAGGTIVNSGTIKSLTSNSTTTDSGINFTGAGSITNSGTIMSATGGLAIIFNGSATHTLTLNTGSILGGNVQGGTGTDGLVLKGSGIDSVAKFLSFETLSMQGTEWNLTGAGTFTTSSEIQSGVLHINGTLTTPTLTVGTAGTLSGTGTVIGAVTVNGTIAPGNSIGTINFTGPYTQATGSTYKPEVNLIASDLINVTGTATIQNGATVAVVVAPGFYTLGQRYTILTASAGVTGQYTTLTDNAPFVDFQLASDTNNIYLDVIRSMVSFEQIAQTRNQAGAASGLQTLTAGNAVFDATVMLDTPNALRAFDLLSGEIHPSIKGMLVDETRFIRDAVIGRSRQAMGGAAAILSPQFTALRLAADDSGTETDTSAPAYAASGGKRARIRDAMDRAIPVKAQPASAPSPGWTAWTTAFGDWGHTASDGNAAALKRATGGFITGIDRTQAAADGALWRFGLAGGYQHTSADVRDRASSGGIDTYQVAAYAARQDGPLGLRGGAAHGWHDISAGRSIVFPGYTDATHAKYGAETTQVFGEVGYGWLHRGFAFEPFAGVAYVHIRTESFAESGGAAALTGTASDSSTTFTTTGLRAAAPLPWHGLGDLTAKASLGWRHAFGMVTPTEQFAFSGSPTSFVIAGVPIARDAVAAELGVDGQIAVNATLGVSYVGQLAAHAQDHGVNARLVQRF